MTVLPGGESATAVLRRAEQERDEASELCDKIAAELRLVTRERDSLARRCTVRFAEKQAVEAELASARTELDAVRRDHDKLSDLYAAAVEENERLRAAWSPP